MTYKYNGLSGGGDCNDNDNTIHPNALELCDGKDNNCNGQIDEGCLQPSVSIANASKSEGNKGQSNMVVTVSLNKTSTKKVTVSYVTQNGTATAGSDYTAKSGTVSISAGSLTATISISVNGDKTTEPDETFTVALSNPVNATLGNSIATGTILNDDGSVAAASSITLEKDKRALTIMPNPVSSMVKVNLEGYTGDVTIQLSNSEGKLLKQEKLIADKFAQKQLDVSKYANGVYFITAIDEKGNRQIEKLIVSH